MSGKGPEALLRGLAGGVRQVGWAGSKTAAMGDVVRWQYTVVDIGSLNATMRLQGALGQLGSEGWELVHVYDKASNWLDGMEKGFALFKRPVAPGEEPDGPWSAVLDLTSFAPADAPGPARSEGRGWW
jgi:hypothetical protein